MKPFDEIEKQFFEIKNAIVDVLEKALAKKGASIPNKERDKEIADGEDPDSLAIIFGSDYYHVTEDIADAIRTYRWSEPNPDKCMVIVDRIMDAFLKVTTKTVFPNDRFSDTEVHEMKVKVKDILVRYGILNDKDTAGIEKVLKSWSAGKPPFNRQPKVN